MELHERIVLVHHVCIIISVHSEHDSTIGFRISVRAGASGEVCRCYAGTSFEGIRVGCAFGEVCRRLQAMQAITW